MSTSLRSVSRLAALATLALAAQAVGAQQPAGPMTPPAPAVPAAHAATSAMSSSPFSFGLAVTSMAIDPASANANLVHNQTVGLQLDAGYVYKHILYFGIDMGPQMLSDHGSFTQATTGGDRTSTASVIYFSGTVGARTPSFTVVPGRWSGSLALLGGASATTGKRSIDNCVDCYTSDISIPGGAFVQPTFLVGGDGARLRFAHRQYLDGKGIRYVSSLGMEFGGH